MSSPAFLTGVTEFILSWFQYLVNGVVSLLSGSGSGGGFIRWLSESWLSLLTVLLIGGSVVNLIIYLIRWRPQWWWFAKKRMVVDDALVRKPVRKSSAAQEKKNALFGDDDEISSPRKTVHTETKRSISEEEFGHAAEKASARSMGLFGDEFPEEEPVRRASTLIPERHPNAAVRTGAVKAPAAPAVSSKPRTGLFGDEESEDAPSRPRKGGLFDTN